MFAALLEVLRDLWLFVWGDKKNSRSDLLLNEVNPQGFEDRGDSLPSNTELIEDKPYFKAATQDVLGGQTAYVGADILQCLTRPVVAFDTVVGVVHYGDLVHVHEVRGLFAHINTDRVSGWVKVDDLVDVKDLIFPTFRPGYLYNYKNQETIKLRNLLKDEMMGGELSLSLQSEELMVYLLRQKGVNINWPNVRPRKAGSWQRILKGVTGVSIGIEPKTGSVMETTGNEISGFMGLVSEVKPDGSIKLITIGREVDGEYREEVFSRKEWIEWRPIFISFT